MADMVVIPVAGRIAGFGEGCSYQSHQTRQGILTSAPLIHIDMLLLPTVRTNGRFVSNGLKSVNLITQSEIYSTIVVSTKFHT